MSAATDYLDKLLGNTSSGSPGATMGPLFGDSSASDYLDKLLGVEKASSTAPPTATADAAPKTLSAEQAKYGSYGDASDFAGVDLSNVDSVKAMAAKGGWADPTAFSLDMLTPSTNNPTGDSGVVVDGTAQFKPEFAKARAMGEGFNTPNSVQVTYAGLPDDHADAKTPQSYRVLAGNVPGQKRQTHLFHNYDKEGKFTGSDVQVAEHWYEEMAPVIQMGLMATGFGGGLAALGGAANSALGLGLGKVGTAALGGALAGGGISALTGQNPIKGAAVGALGSAVGAYNPAGAMGISQPLQGMANNVIGSVAKSAVTGEDVGDAVTGSVINNAFPTMGKILRG